MHGIHSICNRGLHASIAFVVTMLSTALHLPAWADTWRGTAPFCAGQCLPGETQISTSSHGDGGQCWTGNKVICRNAQLHGLMLFSKLPFLPLPSGGDHVYKAFADAAGSDSKASAARCRSGRRKPATRAASRRAAGPGIVRPGTGWSRG
jgi:hypothetical protein